MAAWTVPARLDAWYLVASPDEVGPGELRPFELHGERFVLGRTSRGLAALGARCPHMGANLGAGALVHDRFVCPLHGLAFDADGLCARPGVPPARRLAVEERCGAVFVHPGRPSGPAPGAERWHDLVWAPARAERVPVSPAAILVNAFDLHHLRVVHRRQLVEEPTFEEPSPDRLRMRYATRVAGAGLSDRAMQAVSRGKIALWLTCIGGTVLVVEADLGRTRTAAVVGLVPDGEGTWLRLSVGVPAGRLGWMRAWMARWLYVTFLRRDLPALAGASLQPFSDLPEDAPVQRLLAFVDRQPRL